MEADRFQHLVIPKPAFKTETLAVLGEYNKNSAKPGYKLYETLRATAFKIHHLQHTTMGFLKDIAGHAGRISSTAAISSRLLPA